MIKTKATTLKTGRSTSIPPADLGFDLRTNGKAGARKIPDKFDLSKIPPAVKKSPLKLRDWLDLHIPWLLGPRVDAV